MVLRNNRRSTGGITKSVVLDPVLVKKVTAEAEREGHNNFSQIVARALREFFSRMPKEEKAA